MLSKLSPRLGTDSLKLLLNQRPIKPPVKYCTLLEFAAAIYGQPNWSTLRGICNADTAYAIKARATILRDRLSGAEPKTLRLSELIGIVQAVFDESSFPELVALRGGLGATKDLPSGRQSILILGANFLDRIGWDDAFGSEFDLIHTSDEPPVPVGTKNLRLIVLMDLTIRRVPEIVRIVDTYGSKGFKVPILGITLQSSPTFALRMARAGCQANLAKEASIGEIRDVIRRLTNQKPEEAYAGQNAILVSESAANHESKLPEECLSRREFEVFSSIGSGASERQIAHALGISKKSVHSYKEHISKKLGLRTSSDVFKAALEWGRVARVPDIAGQSPNTPSRQIVKNN